MTKAEKIAAFDPSGVASHGGIFGLPFDLDESAIAFVPVPWEVTVSYATGTLEGPGAIFNASFQVDLYDPVVQDAWKLGMYMVEEAAEIRMLSETTRAYAEMQIESLEKGTNHHGALEEVNAACEQMVQIIEQQTAALLEKGKFVFLLGGDHSTPLGYLKALAAKHPDFGVLQIDAHADLRKAFEGFTYSHASISYNFLELPQVTKLVQVGIRDYCDEEVRFIANNPNRIKVFFDRDLKHGQYAGISWGQQVDEIISQLPEKVYISFDIDGLDPKLCPSTGTPVAGGFEAEQVLYLVEKLVESGRKIIGMDLNEVAPGVDEWDANVAARLAFRLANLAAKSLDLMP
jgi:agmatinase